MSDIGLLVVLGKQGAGKGTQCARLSVRYGIPHVATGDMLRAAVRSGTPLGGKVKQLMDEGHLVPDDLITDVVAHRLAEPDCEHGAILDGYPRTEAQGHSLDAIADPNGGIARCIILDVPTSLVVERLSARRVCEDCGTVYSATSGPAPKVCVKCGGKVMQRPDDVADVITERLAEYEQETFPLIEHYQGRNLLTRVDGVGTPDEVFQRLCDVVDSLKAR